WSSDVCSSDLTIVDYTPPTIMCASNKTVAPVAAGVTGRGAIKTPGRAARNSLIARAHDSRRSVIDNRHHLRARRAVPAGVSDTPHPRGHERLAAGEIGKRADDAQVQVRCRRAVVRYDWHRKIPGQTAFQEFI